jgi:hypothetical protein
MATKSVWILAAAAAALALSACGERGGSEPAASDRAGVALESRPADAPRAEPEVSNAFEYLRYAVNTEAATPELCLTFSGALDPSVDYSAYVQVDEPISLEVDGSQLCIGGLNYGQTRQLTLRAGLPAADGRELASDETTTLVFDDRPARVAFSGSGIILPRIEADGLAIQTVNVDEVAVTVQRLTDRAVIFRDIDEGFEAAAGSWYWGGSGADELGVTVFEGRVDTDGDTNANVTTVLPIAEMLGTLQPGAYYVELTDAAALDREDREPAARAGRWLIVTDLAFTAYRGETGLEVVVRSLDTAQPVRGVEVQLLARSNEILATRRTDAAGRLTFDGPLLAGDEGDAPRMLTAYGPEGDFALLDLNRAPVDLSDEPVTGRAPAGVVDGYVYLDRGIYRPGETVHASALLRGPSGDAIVNRAGSMVLYQPNGLEQARVRFDGARDAGGLSADFDLPRAAARGSWRLAAEIDGLGTVGQVSFQVEDFVPQRVELTLDVDADTPMELGETRMIEANARFLYGAPGAGLPIDGEARLQRDPSPFPDWRGFSFGLHDEQFSERFIELPDVTADGAGSAQLPLSAGRLGSESSYPLRLRAVVRVQEPGGRAVADDVRVPYRPREVYAGLRADYDGRARRNAPVSFSAIAVNASGEAVEAALDWRLVRRDFDYDWYRTGGGEWRWRRTERIVPITQGLVRSTAEGAASIETPPLDWGSYHLIASYQGQDVASRAFWVGWGGRSVEGEAAPDQVTVDGPQDPVSVGEAATITVQAPYAGLADIVVATDRVLDVQQIEVTDAGAEISVPVTDDWGQGAYVMVTVHTPRDPVDQPLPRRAVGVAYVPVDVSPRTFDIALDAPEVVEPNQTITIDVSATTGPNESVFLTLAAVDEGILLLTGHQSPNPVDVFFGKERLGVDLLDDYGRLLDPNQGAAASLRSGGDQIGGAGLSVVPTRSVALFSGIVELGRDGQGQVELDLPDFNGELRLMAVAWSRTGLGAGDRPITVRDAVPAELILPRFLAPGDEAEATVTLDNVDGPDGEYAITVSAEGPVTVEGGAVTMGLAPGEREDGSARLIGQAEGIARLGLSVDGPGDFTAASDYPIQVRSPYLPATRIERIVLRAGQSYTPDAAMLDGYTTGSAELQVTAASSPIDAAALYGSLYRYPYACSEQLVSRVMPLVYAEQLAALAGDDAPDGAAGEVRSAIETILSRQSGDGAFGLWRMGDRQASPWIGAYTTDFLVRAAEAGYPVPEAALSRALSSLQPISQGELWRSGYDDDIGNPNWTRDTRQRLLDRSGAYALYVLARAGQADRSRLRYMHDERLREIESPLARAHIAAGLAAMGDRARAASAFEAAVRGLGYDNPGDWYQTPLRDRAGVLALAAEAGFGDLVEELAQPLARDMREPARLTTQEKAWLILAARALSGDSDTVSVSYDGQASNPAAVTFDDASIGEAGTFTNTGDRPIFLSVMATGSPSEAPEPVSSELEIVKRVLTTDGRPADLSAARQGDRFVIALTLSPKRQARASYIIADLLPAGFEIEALLTQSDAGETGVYSFLGDLARTDVAEARDDRFVAAITTSPRYAPSSRVAYVVRAVTPGEFAIPGAVAEDMYAPDVFARSQVGRVRIGR